MITIVEEYTTKEPITMIGRMAGVCYNSPTDDPEKNYKRGIHNLNSGHGRTLEFPEVYLIIEDYSARFMRELYTHIGGMPTRLQASTRYIDYANNEKSLEYMVPDGLTSEQENLYDDTINTMFHNAQTLREMGVSKEDVANLLPLGMMSKMVYKVNLRTLIDMSHQRMCTCAYWEYRQLMRDLCKALSDYSEEWAYLVKNYFVPKCELTGYCNEGKRGCGRKPLELRRG